MSDTMKAVILHGPGDLRVEDVPLPEAQPNQWLVRVAACGICGSDLRYYAGENPWAKHTLGRETPNPPGMILGHEIGGHVDLRGHRRWQPVSVLAFRACGVCAACRRGDEQLCAATAHLGHGAGWQGQNAGGMAEWCPAWQEHVYPLHDRIDIEAATFLDGLAVAVHAVRNAAIRPMSGVVVLGAGPIGLMIAQTARAFGAGPVLLTDVYEAPLTCAREFGLMGLEVGQKPARDAAEEIAGQIGVPVLAVFDTTGDREAQKLGLRLLDPGGRLMLMAGVAKGLTLSARDLAGERALMTCSNHQYPDFGVAHELLALGRVQVKPMITHRFPLEEAPEAFAVAADKVNARALKVILTVG
jgi:threonine dehydrogenase-like Zn-dependent dehydrogenase